MNEVSLFFNIITDYPDALVSSWHNFTIVMAEIVFLNSSHCRIGDLPSVASLAKNESPMGKVSTLGFQ
jgi:hypothetical protein